MNRIETRNSLIPISLMKIPEVTRSINTDIALLVIDSLLCAACRLKMNGQSDATVTLNYQIDE